MDKKKFYDQVRASIFRGRLNYTQVQGIELILNHWLKAGYTDLRWLAYILATVYHETAHTMQPVEEYGKGRGRRYGRKQKMSGRSYSVPDKLYYGRGHVQLTWYENYDKMGKLLNIPLLEQPELALVPDISLKILFEGMTRGVSRRGDFTGVSLEDYFNTYKEDWVGARKIINGLDRASKIAGYAKEFYKALKS